MAKISTPVEGFTGNVASVAFADGKGQTNDVRLIKWFQANGYEVELSDSDKKAIKEAEEAARASLGNGNKLKQLEEENAALKGRIKKLSEDETLERVKSLEGDIAKLTEENAKLKADKSDPVSKQKGSK